jgi:predicted O-methyltransferase YrrM
MALSLKPPAVRVYVALVRALGRALDAIGLLRFMESRSRSRAWLYARSLFSIYDAEGLARLDLPWWSFGAIEHIDALLRRRGSDVTVFEYGSGASTAWLARRCRRVHSVEHDPEWAERARALCRGYDNVEVRAIAATPANRDTRCRSQRAGWTGLSFDRYVESIRDYPFAFDLIVIDGRCRVECLVEAERKIKDGGLIVFDDSDRRRYRQAIDRTALRRETFRGLVPGLPCPGETTVLHAAPDASRAATPSGERR